MINLFVGVIFDKFVSEKQLAIRATTFFLSSSFVYMGACT